MITNEEKEKILQFEANCNEMINGKFILADIKIAKILKSIANSKELYAYLAECLLNFDFAKEFEKAKGVDFTKNYFKMPEEAYKKVALVFCLLIEIDNKNIDFYDFVVKYFKTEKDGDEYGLFTRTMLIPFRDEILKHFNLYDYPTIIDELPTSENDVQSNGKDIKNELINHLQSMINVIQISPKINDEKKERLNIILNAFIEGVKINNKKILFALEIALADNVYKVKQLNAMYKDLLDMLIRFYN
ncbi:MAG: hypothetical protein ACI4TX_04655 [Christensenellales bacterium]